jgi:ADP-ribose pyrophosphatase
MPMQKQDLQRWERLATQPLLDHPYCRIVEDLVRLPSGDEARWWRFAGTHEVACIICLDAQQRVLIAYQYNNAPQQVVDEFPGGGVEAHESAVEAARRELVEETGFFAKHLRELGSFWPNNRRSAERMRIFLATELEYHGAQPESNEYVAYEWVAIAEIEQRIRMGALENGTLLAAWSIFRATVDLPDTALPTSLGHHDPPVASAGA